MILLNISFPLVFLCVRAGWFRVVRPHSSSGNVSSPHPSFPSAVVIYARRLSTTNLGRVGIIHSTRRERTRNVACWKETERAQSIRCRDWKRGKEAAWFSYFFLIRRVFVFVCGKRKNGFVTRMGEGTKRGRGRGCGFGNPTWEQRSATFSYVTRWESIFRLIELGRWYPIGCFNSPLLSITTNWKESTRALSCQTSRRVRLRSKFSKYIITVGVCNSRILSSFFLCGARIQYVYQEKENKNQSMLLRSQPDTNLVIHLLLFFLSFKNNIFLNLSGNA